MPADARDGRILVGKGKHSVCGGGEIPDAAVEIEPIEPRGLPENAAGIRNALPQVRGKRIEKSRSRFAPGIRLERLKALEIKEARSGADALQGIHHPVVDHAVGIQKVRAGGPPLTDIPIEIGVRIRIGLEPEIKARLSERRHGEIPRLRNQLEKALGKPFERNGAARFGGPPPNNGEAQEPPEGRGFPDHIVDALGERREKLNGFARVDPFEDRRIAVNAHPAALLALEAELRAF